MQITIANSVQTLNKQGMLEFFLILENCRIVKVTLADILYQFRFLMVSLSIYLRSIYCGV